MPTVLKILSKMISVSAKTDFLVSTALSWTTFGLGFRVGSLINIQQVFDLSNRNEQGFPSKKYALVPFLTLYLRGFGLLGLVQGRASTFTKFQMCF